MTALFHGTVTAAAIVLDPGLTGAAEARRRALALAPAALLELPDRRWLAVLRDPLETRVERAPGLALVAVDGGFAMPGLSAGPGTVALLSAGERLDVALADLPPVATDGWLDLSGLPTVRLSPADEAPPAAQEPVEPPRHQPDLRAAAGLRSTGIARRRRRTRVAHRPRTYRAWPVVLLLAALCAVGVGVWLVTRPSGRPGALARGSSPSVAASASVTPSDLPSLPSGFPSLPDLQVPTDLVSPATSDSSTHFPPIGPIILAVTVFALGVRRLLAEDTGPRGTRQREVSRPRNLRRRLRRGWSRLIRRPAQGVLARRQARYLERLTGQLNRRQWHDLLSDAIALGGAQNAWMRLRLPASRTNLRLSTTSAPGGPAVAFSGNAHAYLRALYSEAARALERAGDIEQATFVYAELLRDVPAAVALLEQQGRMRLAAEIAEGRGLDPALAVRLWWRAGERDEAVRVARARNAFASGVVLLQQVDSAAAIELRRTWVESCRAANDPVGAVEAAWPVPELRRAAHRDIAAGMALGGAVAGRLFGHLVTGFPSPGAGDRAVALLTSEDRSLHRARDAFLAVVAEEASHDPALDRRVCSAAARSLLRAEPTKTTRAQLHALRNRVDPILRADLPPVPARRADLPAADLSAPDEPGMLQVTDAVALPGGVVLVAHGAAGVRLYGPNGRTRAQWDVVAHRIVLADNGAAALLVREAGTLQEVLRLDLLTRRVRPWTTLRSHDFTTSFDGTTVTALDADGIVFLDTLAERPRVLWRELDPMHRVHALNRTPRALTAIVTAPAHAGPMTQLWVWELPSRTLRVRRTIEVAPGMVGVAGDGTALLWHRSGPDAGEGDAKLTYVRAHDRDVTVPVPDGSLVTSDGTVTLVQRPVGDEILGTVESDAWTTPTYVRFPAASEAIGLRAHDGIVTLYDATGRLVVADPAGAGVLATLTTRV